jgi:tRNA pseudouridine55 synthase
MLSERAAFFQEGQVLLFNKPLYWTSFDLVNNVRIILRSKLEIKKIKVGHAGTLDPLATGLMIICTGKATKRIEEFMGLEKEYVATLHVGATTPSFDLETETDGKFPTDHISEDLVIKTIGSFIGEQKQIPPLHSAKYIDGKRAYEFARKGIMKEMTPVNIFIRELELLSFRIPEITIKMICSKGTYVRSFARDFGLAINSGCFLSALQRNSIGRFNLSDAFTLEKFEEYIEQM